LPIRTFGLIRTAARLDDDDVWLHVMVRPGHGQSIESANAALRAAQPAIREAAAPRRDRDTDTFLKEPLVLTGANLGVSPLRNRFERPLVILLGVVSAVLIIAAVNIANLLLARGVARRHELSVRLALGASRWHLARQLLVESVILGCAGMVVGGVFARWASAAAVMELSTFINPIGLDLPLDGEFRVHGRRAHRDGDALRPDTVLWTTRVQPFDALKSAGRSGRPPDARRRRLHRRAGRAVAGARDRRRLLLRTFVTLQRRLRVRQGHVLAITLSRRPCRRSPQRHITGSSRLPRARRSRAPAVRPRRWCPSCRIRSW
jgi:hypothetical protein